MEGEDHDFANSTSSSIMQQLGMLVASGGGEKGMVKKMATSAKQQPPRRRTKSARVRTSQAPDSLAGMLCTQVHRMPKNFPLHAAYCPPLLTHAHHVHEQAVHRRSRAVLHTLKACSRSSIKKNARVAPSLPADDMRGAVLRKARYIRDSLSNFLLPC